MDRYFEPQELAANIERGGESSHWRTLIEMTFCLALQSSSVAKCCAPARMSASGKLRHSIESLRERQLRAVTNVRQTYQTWAASSSKEHPQDPEQALRLNRPRRE